MYCDTATLRRFMAVANDPRRFDIRRAALMNTLFGVWSSVHAVNRAFEFVDSVRYPDALDEDVGEPVYIVAAPRSGTTFLHRLMSFDQGFATFKLLQTIFPYVTANDIGAAIQRSRGPIAKLTDTLQSTISESSFGGWEGVHDTGLDQDEEDEAIWALFMATPAVLILLPFPEEFEHLRFVDKLPEEQKARMVRDYREVLQRRRHHDPGKTLLLKNVLLPGRYEIITRAAPRARFVHIVRHPYEVIASSLSLFTLPWTVLAKDAYGPTDRTRDFADLLIDYYRFFYERERESLASGDGRIIPVRYDDLVAEPLVTLRKVYAALGRPFTPELEASYGAELRGRPEHKSSHDYSLEAFGLDEAYIQRRLGDVMDYYGFAR